MSGGRLAGKVAIVTGAGSVGPGWGNGRAMAVRLPRRARKSLPATAILCAWKKPWRAWRRPGAR